MLRKREPVYQALWASPCDFDEVLISPVMIQDHMPDNMLKALNKVSEHALLPLRAPGTYEPLEETREPSAASGAVDVNRLVLGVDEEAHQGDESPGSTTLIVVDVEVHQRNEMQPGS